MLSISPPAQRPTAGFTFAVVTDPHCDETPASVRHSQGLGHVGNGVARLRLCWDAIRGLEDAPEFVLLLGDIGLGCGLEVLGEAPCPIHAVAGNHEWGERRERLRALFPGDFGEDASRTDYYAFDHHGVRFIGICNAGTGNEHVGQLASEEIWPPGQSDWIQDQMCGHDGLKILFGHCPPEPRGFDRAAYLERASSQYLPLMGENDSRFIHSMLSAHAPAVAFFGHTHRESSREAVGGSVVQVVRSACWNHDEEPIGFQQVHVSPEAVWSREIITATCRSTSS